MKPADEAALLAGLRALRESAADVTAPASIETALRAEFRRKDGLRKRANSVWKPLVLAGLAAAGAVVMAVLAMILQERPMVLTEVPGRAAVMPVVPETAVAHSPRPAPAIKRLRRKPRIAVEPAHEIATEFLRLPDAPQFTLEDRGQLVRVRLPRESMRNFGLPVNEDRVEQAVKADVLVGEDGIARAIRFVH